MLKEIQMNDPIDSLVLRRLLLWRASLQVQFLSQSAIRDRF